MHFLWESQIGLVLQANTPHRTNEPFFVKLQKHWKIYDSAGQNPFVLNSCHFSMKKSDTLLVFSYSKHKVTERKQATVGRLRFFWGRRCSRISGWTPEARSRICVCRASFLMTFVHIGMPPRLPAQDQCMLSHDISACSATWSLTAQSHDQRLSVTGSPYDKHEISERAQSRTRLKQLSSSSNSSSRVLNPNK